MCLKHYPVRPVCNPSNQRGSMLVIALFVIIVLALLGLTMTRLLSSSSESIIHEVLGQRALNAARAGIECEVARQFGAGCNVSTATELAPIEFNGVAGLENCNYIVTPASKPLQDGIQRFTYWSFASEGQCRAGKINVTRFVYVDVMLREDDAP